jgi:hypothetical protein
MGFDNEAEALMIGPWLMPRQHETQSETVRARRGPYSSKHKAERAATKHFDGKT